VPHEFVDMATFHTTETGTMNVQVRIGGDLALLRGVAKAVFEAAEKDPDVLDRDFIERCTHGIEEYRALVEATAWADLIGDSGVDERGNPQARRVLPGIQARHHRLVPGAHAARARRRHSGRDRQPAAAEQHRPRRSGAVPRPRAQQRAGKPHLRHQSPSGPGVSRPARRGLRVRPPREHGLGTIETIEAMRSGEVKVFIALGSNFALATPDAM
jgi:anaerobic selenocysteine-containing dehydrogenase